MTNPDCVLCGSSDTCHLQKDETRMNHVRDYYRCRNCQLVFVPPDQRLTPEEEFKRYEMHENSPDDPDYRKFLSRMFEPINRRIAPQSYGLDFGSGPGPTLSVMLEEAGHTVELFDIFYANNPAVFEKEYDFITTTETVEHLFNPLAELNRLWSCLKRGGWFGIMTKRNEGDKSFKNWHYKNDDTHVIFFSKKTFRWLGERWNSDPEFEREDVVLFQKQRLKKV